MKKLVLALLLACSTLLANEYKAVFDLSTGNYTKLNKALIDNIKALDAYYTSGEKQHTLSVVISGDAYKFFVDDLENSPYKDNSELAKVKDALSAQLIELNAKYGVKFYMCVSGLEKRKIPRESLYFFIKANKTKSMYLIELQNKGFAYLPIH